MFCHNLAILFLLIVSNHIAEGSWCLHMAWEGNNIKVVDDCDILNNEILVSVAKLTDKSECIKELYLDIEGEAIGVWRNTAGRNVNEVAFKNLLSDRLEKIKTPSLLVTVTAKVLEPPRDLTTQFTIDARSCPVANDETTTTVKATDEETTEKNQDDDIWVNANSNVIVAISITILLVIIALVTVVILRKRSWYEKPVKIEENDIYGVYSRAWGGEGEYGDGDKVYVTDNNDYYAVN